MEIDDYFHADLACPVDTLLEELCCTFRVRRIGVVERPVSNRDSDHIETTVSDLLKVRKLHPFLPVGPQDIVECCLCAEGLCESVLVDDASRVVVFLEDRWGDPGLKDKPSTKVDSTDFLVSPREGRILVRAPVNDKSVDYRQLRSAANVAFPNLRRSLGQSSSA